MAVQKLCPQFVCPQQPQTNQKPYTICNWFLGALLTALKGMMWAVAAMVAFGIVLVLWASNEGRTPAGGWEAAQSVFLSILRGFAVWGAGVGFFCHRLPQRFGPTTRSLLAISCGVTGGLIPAARAMLSGGEDWLHDALFFGISGLFFGLLFGFASQFGKGNQAERKEDDKSENQN